MFIDTGFYAAHLCVGYGFVEYALAEEAANAIHALNGAVVLNKRLKVSYSRKPNPEMKDANVYIAGVNNEHNVSLIN